MCVNIVLMVVHSSHVCRYYVLIVVHSSHVWRYYVLTVVHSSHVCRYYVLMVVYSSHVWRYYVLTVVHSSHLWRYYVLMVVHCQNTLIKLEIEVGDQGLSDRNGTRTHNHLVRKRTLNQVLRTKWLWVRSPLQSLNLQVSRLFRARSSLTFR